MSPSPCCLSAASAACAVAREMTRVLSQGDSWLVARPSAMTIFSIVPKRAAISRLMTGGSSIALDRGPEVFEHEEGGATQQQKISGPQPFANVVIERVIRGVVLMPKLEQRVEAPTLVLVVAVERGEVVDDELSHGNCLVPRCLTEECSSTPRKH